MSEQSKLKKEVGTLIKYLSTKTELADDLKEPADQVDSLKGQLQKLKKLQKEIDEAAKKNADENAAEEKRLRFEIGELARSLNTHLTLADSLEGLRKQHEELTELKNEKDKANKKADPEYVIADGLSITSKRGILGPGAEIKAGWLAGGKHSFDSLLKGGHIKKNKKK